MAVYGNSALATDHTIFKAVDANGKLAVTGEARCAQDIREGEREVEACIGRWLVYRHPSNLRDRVSGTEIGFQVALEKNAGRVSVQLCHYAPR